MTKNMRCSLHRCYVSDNFIRGTGQNINPDGVNEAWTAPWGGSWVSFGSELGQLGYVHQSSTASVYILLANNYLTDNPAISCDFTTYPTSSVNGGWVSGLYANFTTQNNHIWTYITNGILYLRKIINGVESGMASVEVPNLYAVDKHNIKLIIDYGDYSLLLDDELKASGHDTDLIDRIGAVGLKSKYSNGWFFNFFLYDRRATREGQLWFTFFMDDYNIKPSVRTNKVPIPGRYGDRLQTAGEGNKVYNITGKVFSHDFDIDSNLGLGESHGTSVDYAMETLYQNNHPVCIFTPEFTTSGIVTDYSFPKATKGRTSKVADITIELTEKYFYER